MEAPNAKINRKKSTLTTRQMLYVTITYSTWNISTT